LNYGRCEDKAFSIMGSSNVNWSFIGFDIIGIPSYTSAYAIFLIIVGLVFNELTVWYAWKWCKQES